jgi:hypothetical protein
MAIDSQRTEPRSRRAILAGAIGGVAAVVASRFASPDRTSAAAGGPVIMGAANSAGTTNTSLTTASSGTALLITQTGTGTALRGSAVGAGSIAGFFTANNGTGISGVTGAPGSYGVFAENNGAAGSAGALRANGHSNHGIVASTASNAKYAITATGANGTAAILGTAIQIGVEGTGYRGVYGHTSGSGASAGVFGNNTGSGDTYGVLGQASGTSNANGVYGNATGGSGTAYGVTGTSNSDSGAGVRGMSGVTYGVLATTSDAGTSALFAENTDTSTGNSQKGVFGVAHGEGFIILFFPIVSAGVFGQNNTTTGSVNAGVWGESFNPTGAGVRAFNWGGSGDSAGIIASTLGDFAGKFIGDVDVAGTLTKTAGTFKIDHPLAPTTKWLYHSFVESPDMKNVYDGVVTLDAKGEATVALPSYFDALNRDARYQLTAMGKSAPGLYVKSEATSNKFSIAGGVAGQKVSWQVTGIRQDAYAKARPVVAEVAKTGADKGKYLHPEAHGQAASKGVNYVASGRAALDKYGTPEAVRAAREKAVGR